MINDLKVFDIFPTAKFKRIFYPIRPWFTLFQGAIFAALGLTGILPVGLAMWLALVICMDDLVMVPYLRLAKSFENRLNNRKKWKSNIAIFMVLFGIIAGACFFALVLAHSIIFISILSSVIQHSGSILLTGGLGIAGGCVARLAGISPLVGMAIGSTIGYAIPLLFGVCVPLFAECVFSGAAIGGFLATVITKDVLRIYYRLRNGHSNVDGYDFNVYSIETEKDRIAAKTLQMAPEAVTNLRCAAMEVRQAVKKQCHLGHDITGTRWQYTNSFKDILHTLNRACTEADREKLLYLLQEAHKVTTKASYTDTVGNTKYVYSEHEYQEINPLQVNSDLNSHTLFYRQGMEAGLSKIPKDTANKFVQAIDIAMQSMRQPRQG